MDLAEQAGLDLVEISPNAAPPVCKIMDFGKYKYEQQKRESEARKKQKIIEVKEVKFRPGTDTHDYEVKMRSVLKFLEKGDKVKITLRFRGREMAHQDLGRELLHRVSSHLSGSWTSVNSAAPCAGAGTRFFRPCAAARGSYLGRVFVAHRRSRKSITPTRKRMRPLRPWPRRPVVV